MSQRTCKRTEVYPRYLRSNAARAPKHRLWEPPQNDRQSWPSTFGCEMFTVNVCVESCLASRHNHVSDREKRQTVAFAAGTFALPAPNPVRLLPHRTRSHCPRCALCVAPTHACSAQKMAKLWLRAEFKPGERRSVRASFLHFLTFSQVAHHSRYRQDSDPERFRDLRGAL